MGQLEIVQAVYYVLGAVGWLAVIFVVCAAMAEDDEWG